MICIDEISPLILTNCQALGTPTHIRDLLVARAEFCHLLYHFQDQTIFPRVIRVQINDLRETAILFELLNHCVYNSIQDESKKLFSATVQVSIDSSFFQLW